MDETLKPLRIPPQIRDYADKHNVSHLVQTLVTSLVVDRPEDPVSYLISQLQRSSVDIPRVMLLGPPAVGKDTLAKRLSSQLKAVHVTLKSLLQDQSELSALTEKDVSAEVLVHLVQQRLMKIDCFHRGWVLDGIPQTSLQARLLQQAGIIPEHVVMLETRRGSLVDPLTEGAYQQTFIYPADGTIAKSLEGGCGLSEEQLLAKLQHYQCEVTDLMSAYQPILKVISGDQPHAEVYQRVLNFVQTRRQSRTPKILLLGPAGCGKSHQARLLSEKYKMVDVCCEHLLRSVAADGSRLGTEVQMYLDNEHPVPDSLILQVLEERLSQVDCSCRGWILHGFPCDWQQARSLQDSQHQPNRVFVLKTTDEVCLERITLRATDPVSGERYHTVTRPAPSAEVQNRLQTAPNDSLDTVTQRLKQYRTCSTAIQSVYPDAVHIDANQDSYSVFEALESQLNVD